MAINVFNKCLIDKNGLTAFWGAVQDYLQEEAYVWKAKYADEAGKVAWGSVTGRPSTMVNPKPIKFKKTDGSTVVTYDGSTAVDLTAGIHYAATAGSAQTVPYTGVTGHPTTMPNPKVIKFKKAGATAVTTYDGSSEVDMTAGVNYATTAGTANAVAWGNVSGRPSTMANPNAIQFKDAAGTAASYTGSTGVDLTSGIHYARYAYQLSDTTGSDAGTATTAGSATQPVYFSEGRPVPCSYTIAASVPQDAKFTDTNTKVTNNTTTSQYYLCGSTSSTNTTGTLVKRADVYVNNSGSVFGTAFFDTSDESLKNFADDVEVDFEKLAKLPKKYFTWKEGDDALNIGTSAQEVQKIYPEIVAEREDGKLTVDYAKLSIIALKAVDILNERLEKVESIMESVISKLNIA